MVVASNTGLLVVTFNGLLVAFTVKVKLFPQTHCYVTVVHPAKSLYEKAMQKIMPNSNSTVATERVYQIYLMNVAQALGGRRPLNQANQLESQ